MLGVPIERRTQEHNSRLGEVMRALGWERRKLRFGKRTSWGYQNGQGAPIVFGGPPNAWDPGAAAGEEEPF